MEPSRSCWKGTTSALQPEEITSKGTRVSCVHYQLKCPHEKSLETYLMSLVCHQHARNKSYFTFVHFSYNIFQERESV